MNSYPPIQNELIKANKKYINFKKYLNFNKTMGSNPYSQKISCDIEKDQYENILQLGIRATITFNAAGVTTDNLSFLFKSIVLREKGGNDIFELRPQYIKSRISKSTGSSKESYYSAGSLVIDPASTIGTMNVPIISFLGQTENHSIPINYLDTLEVVCIFNDSMVNMGFDEEVVSVETELYVEYFNDSEITVPKSLYDSTSVYYEPDIVISNTVLNKVGSIKYRLINNFPCFNVGFVLINNATLTLGTVNKITIITNQERNVICLKSLNFNEYDEDNHYEENGPFIHWFSKYQKRTMADGKNYGLTTFASSMRDTYVEVEYNLPLASDYTLYTFEDIKTYFQIENKKLMPNNTDLGSVLFQG